MNNPWHLVHFQCCESSPLTIPQSTPVSHHPHPPQPLAPTGPHSVCGSACCGRVPGMWSPCVACGSGSHRAPCSGPVHVWRLAGLCSCRSRVPQWLPCGAPIRTSGQEPGVQAPGLRLSQVARRRARAHTPCFCPVIASCTAGKWESLDKFGQPPGELPSWTAGAGKTCWGCPVWRLPP